MQTPSNTPLWWTTLPDGSSIAVPDDLTVMSRWVLEEQGDWFEDELRFVRRWFPQGGIAIDVGANYGVYTLALAAKGGSKTRVASFEPTPAVVECLRASLDRNGFSHVELIEAAVSDRSGRGRLRLGSTSELSELDSGASEVEGVDVDLVFLDQWWIDRDRPDVDFLKLDAEGAEVEVLAGAGRMLEACDPLLLCELKHGEDVNLSMCAALRRSGRELLRLVPGPQILVPFDEGGPIDGYQMNILACGPERARRLEDDGWLVRSIGTAAGSCSHEELSSWIADHGDLPEPADWSGMPADLVEAISCLVAATSSTAAASARMSATTRAFELAAAIVEDLQEPAMLASCAEIAYFAGERTKGNAWLARGTESIFGDPHARHRHPCLQRGVRGESEPPDLLGLRTAMLSRLETRLVWSNQFHGLQNAKLLRLSAAMGRLDPAIDRRLKLESRVLRGQARP